VYRSTGSKKWQKFHHQEITALMRWARILEMRDK
jgi:hypothetical protein